MHGQAEQISTEPPPSAGYADPQGYRPDARTGQSPSFAQLPGVALYLVSLVLELPAAFARGLLAYVGVLIVGQFLALGLSAEAIAWGAAFAPLAWSVVAFAAPGRGRVWSRRLGARGPSRMERDAIDDSLRILGCGADQHASRPCVYVLDEPLASATVRGRALVVSRGLLGHEGLPAVLAHELGHLGSLDGALSEALNRLCLVPPPLAQPAPAASAEKQLAEEGGDFSAGFLRRALRLLLRLGAGGVGQRALAPLWAAHWRRREHAADAHAAALGQGEQLARYLAEEEMPFDVPVPHLLASPALHPPTALRVDRLLGEAS
jgi:Zn-dependent protease with chaperone function